jgi:hypothetical protein
MPLHVVDLGTVTKPEFGIRIIALTLVKNVSSWNCGVFLST